jgi:hypothetical protein
LAGVALLLPGVASSASAAQTTIDFEGLPGMSLWSFTPVPAESKLSNQLVSTYGTVFTSESVNQYIAVVNLGAGHAPSGTNGFGAVNNANNLSYGTPFNIFFFLPASPSTPAATDFISISSDLLPGSGQTATLYAYDYFGNLLGTSSAVDNAPFTLSVSSPGIHSARIVGYDSIAWDLVKFDSPLVAVPEPSSLALVGLGSLAFLGIFYRRAKKA